MELFLGLKDVVRAFSSDDDFILASSNSARRSVAVQARKGRREVYGGVGGRFDVFDVFARPTADQRVQ